MSPPQDNQLTNKRATSHEPPPPPPPPGNMSSRQLSPVTSIDSDPPNSDYSFLADKAIITTNSPIHLSLTPRSFHRLREGLFTFPPSARGNATLRQRAQRLKSRCVACKRYTLPLFGVCAYCHAWKPTNTVDHRVLDSRSRVPVHTHHSATFIAAVWLLIGGRGPGGDIKRTAAPDSNKCTSLAVLQHQFPGPLALNLSTIPEF